MYLWKCTCADCGRELIVDVGLIGTITIHLLNV